MSIEYIGDNDSDKVENCNDNFASENISLPNIESDGQNLICINILKKNSPFRDESEKEEPLESIKEDSPDNLENFNENFASENKG